MSQGCGVVFHSAWDIGASSFRRWGILNEAYSVQFSVHILRLVTCSNICMRHVHAFETAFR